VIFRALWDGLGATVADKTINGVLCLAGASFLFWMWYSGVFSWDVIKYIMTG
jgi:hypothetical protein